MSKTYGCIVGTHVPIKTPNKNGQVFFNYKQFYSLSVHLVYFMDTGCWLS